MTYLCNALLRKPRSCTGEQCLKPGFLPGFVVHETFSLPNVAEKCMILGVKICIKSANP